MGLTGGMIFQTLHIWNRWNLCLVLLELPGRCWVLHLGDAGSCTRNCREGSRRCEQSPSRIVQIQFGSGPKGRSFTETKRLSVFSFRSNLSVGNFARELSCSILLCLYQQGSLMEINPR